MKKRNLGTEGEWVGLCQSRIEETQGVGRTTGSVETGVGEGQVEEGERCGRHSRKRRLVGEERL